MSRLRLLAPFRSAVEAQFIRAGALLLVLVCPSASRATTYDDLRQQIARERRALRLQPGAGRDLAGLERTLLLRIDRLFSAWLGTRWGLGMPQSTRPRQGKINCGLFTAVILRDAGFNLDIWKLNRQDTYHGIRSLAPPRSIRYLKSLPTARFLATVRKLGPGLFLIGLDFHIGFLRQDERGLRFIHASYVTHRVMDEPAAQAIPILSSKRRVMVGKILQPEMLRAWLSGRRIEVLGDR
jgi:hypothetical protein